MYFGIFSRQVLNVQNVNLPVDDSDVTSAKRQKFVLEDLAGVGALVHQVKLGQNTDGSQTFPKTKQKLSEYVKYKNGFWARIKKI